MFMMYLFKKLSNISMGKLPFQINNQLTYHHTTETLPSAITKGIKELVLTWSFGKSEKPGQMMSPVTTERLKALT